MFTEATYCWSVCDDPRIGTLTITTKDGHFDFVINEHVAQEMIQNLKEFLAGESLPLLEP